MSPPFERTARLPSTARVCLVSDLHLGDGTFSDAFGKNSLPVHYLSPHRDKSFFDWCSA